MVERPRHLRACSFSLGLGEQPAQLVVEAIDRMLEYDARFIEAVEEGRAAARRGGLLEHDEVVARIERTLNS
jgi:predicted transcriptional regulator